jgi:hypothetical protein
LKLDFLSLDTPGGIESQAEVKIGRYFRDQCWKCTAIETWATVRFYISISCKEIMMKLTTIVMLQIFAAG